jgi:hypothetical protein
MLRRSMSWEMDWGGDGDLEEKVDRGLQGLGRAAFPCCLLGSLVWGPDLLTGRSRESPTEIRGWLSNQKYADGLLWCQRVAVLAQLGCDGSSEYWALQTGRA